MNRPTLWAFLLGVCLVSGADALAQEHGTSASAEASKIAAQQFKNIQVLKNIPAEQLIPTMQFISASLGVECTFCHVEREMDKDDKKEKQIARKMISMQLAIDQGHFEGKLEVTCTTCHRGSPHPASIPFLSTDPGKTPANVHEANEPNQANLPAADQLMDKYLTAVGGADALHKIKSRVQQGTIDAMGMQSAIEVYSEAPDKRVSISLMHTGTSVTAFNGETGWLSIPGGFHFMTKPEREGAGVDAEFYLPARVREIYKEFKVHSGEEISGRATYLVTATATPGHPALRLYFDQETGLLLRLTRYTETTLGRNPAQIDYADYRETDGVKIPYRWTLARPNGSFTIRIDRTEQNVAIDQKLFVPPSEPAH